MNKVKTAGRIFIALLLCFIITNSLVEDARAMSFQAAEDYATGDGPESLTMADFNGDGKTDLATANSDGDNVSILLGNGAGAFQAAVNSAVGDTPRSVTAADFDGDGNSDLAVANFFSDNVSVLLGNGHGTFQEIGRASCRERG